VCIRHRALPLLTQRAVVVGNLSSDHLQARQTGTGIGCHRSRCRADLTRFRDDLSRCRDDPCRCHGDPFPVTRASFVKLRATDTCSVNS